jgi:sortase A
VSDDLPRTPIGRATGVGGAPARAARRALTALHARPRLRRTAVALNLLVALVGLGLVGYPFATDAWTAHVVQPRLASQLDRPGLASAYREGTVATAAAVTRMRIPRLGVDTVVVQGITVSALRAGTGHYPGTPLPGQRGNVAIAGHRTTYGAPFHDLDRLAAGDEILFETPLGDVTYRVDTAPFVVAPDDTRVIAPESRHLLTLTTCHPLHSAKQRLVVRATLVGEVLP